jgi:hypothetical protein
MISESPYLLRKHRMVAFSNNAQRCYDPRNDLPGASTNRGVSAAGSQAPQPSLFCRVSPSRPRILLLPDTPRVLNPSYT